MNPAKRPFDLDEAVERRRVRREAWEVHGERSLASNLAMVGTVGWLVVVPALVGTFVGRWLDRKWDMGVTLTSGLMCLGLVAGCLLAWRKVTSS